MAANAGWYTMPRYDLDFPYGLGRSGISNDQLRTAFSRKLIVLLGTADNDPNHKYLRKTAQAMAQGKHRLERGETFFVQAKQMAEEQGVPFAWELRKVNGVGHSNSKMSYPAAELITTSH